MLIGIGVAVDACAPRSIDFILTFFPLLFRPGWQISRQVRASGVIFAGHLQRVTMQLDYSRRDYFSIHFLSIPADNTESSRDLELSICENVQSYRVKLAIFILYENNVIDI